jgi:hypothetical protein
MLEGPLVRLEPLGPEDVTDEYVAWLNAPETLRYPGTKFGQTHATVRQYVEAVAPPNLLCRIVEKATGSTRRQCGAARTTRCTGSRSSGS